MSPKPPLVLLFLFFVVPAFAQNHPRLVPKGWIEEIADPESMTRGFSSPDGQSWLMTKQTEADPSSIERDMDEIAFQDGERITYQRRGATWIAVSGYRDNRIFYRKSDLVCSGTRWHHIELQYPRQIKRQMDATVTAIARGMAAQEGVTAGAGWRLGCRRGPPTMPCTDHAAIRRGPSGSRRAGADLTIHSP